jgi:hypothetical protein
MIQRDDLIGIAVGDTVIRMLAGSVPIELEVTAIDDVHFHCGPWKFRRDTGAEVDEGLSFDGLTRTGSYIKEVRRKEA